MSGLENNVSNFEGVCVCISANCFQLWQLAYKFHSNIVLRRQNEISQTRGCNGKRNSFLNEDDEVGAILVETVSEFKTWVRLHQIQARFLFHLSGISVIEDRGFDQERHMAYVQFYQFSDTVVSICVCIHKGIKSHWLLNFFFFFHFGNKWRSKLNSISCSILWVPA